MLTENQMAKKILFLSGSISSCLDTYKEKFAKAEEKLSKAGFIVLNPATLPNDMADDKYMPICFAMLNAADAICMIGVDWRLSGGAMLEKAYAEYQGKDVIYWNEL